MRGGGGNISPYKLLIYLWMSWVLKLLTFGIFNRNWGLIICCTISGDREPTNDKCKTIEIRCCESIACLCLKWNKQTFNKNIFKTLNYSRALNSICYFLNILNCFMNIAKKCWGSSKLPKFKYSYSIYKKPYPRNEKIP